MFHLTELLVFLQIVLIDLSMAGDNALVIGMAAAGLPAAERRQAVFAGIAAATGLRILFAIFAVQILRITGLLAAGGFLLLWVAWKLYEELRFPKASLPGQGTKTGDVSLPAAKSRVRTKSSVIWKIVAADVSMSLDNVLGVAGVARDHFAIMAAGLALSVLLMGAASTFVARIGSRHSWIGYLGLAVVLYTAVRMIGDGLMPFLKP
jgi:YjbE family integral membrane protein